MVGTSAGAVNAAWVAGHGMSTDSLDQLARVWAGLRRSDIFPVDARQVLRGLAGRSMGVTSDAMSAATQASQIWRSPGCRPTWWPQTCSAAMTC